MNRAILRHELASVIRFVLVGLVNTAIGYAIILLALVMGAGDYSANAIGYALGLPLSYVLHRRWTFRASARVSTGEAIRYVVCFVVAYGVNLAVIAAGRSLGLIEHPLVQLVAVCAYAAVFYLLTRIIVFRARG